MTDPTPMTDEELDAIEQRLNAATPKPWYTRPYVDAIHVVDNDEKQVCDISDREIGPTGQPPQNARFIAHAPTDVAGLIAEVRRLRKKIALVAAGVACASE